MVSVLVVVRPSTTLEPVSSVPPRSHVMEGAVEQSLAAQLKDNSSPGSKHAASSPKSEVKELIVIGSKQNECKNKNRSL